MKILHICTNYTDTQLYQKLNEELQKKGIDQTYAVPSSYSTNCSFELNDNVKVLKCYPRWLRIVYRIKQSVIRKEIDRKIEVESYDIIHAHLLFTNGYLAYKFKKKYDIPYVVAVRNTDVNDFFKYMKHLRPLGIKILKEAQSIVFLSKAYYNQMIDKYIPNEFLESFRAKSVILPNGIDNFWLENRTYKSEKLGEEKIDLVYAGRIDKNKNIGSTLEAMKILEQRGIITHLDVVGRVEDKSEYEKIMKDERVTYHSPMKKEQLINMYRKNSVFVMPSFHETFGLVYAEAMSQGLPVIYSKGEGFDGQFEDGMVGYSVEPNNPEMIADSIEKIFRQYGFISGNCSQFVERFNWERIAERYKELYKTILIDEVK